MLMCMMMIKCILDCLMMYDFRLMRGRGRVGMAHWQGAENSKGCWRKKSSSGLYVRSVSLFDEKIDILPKYYKHIARLKYTYGGYKGIECNFIGLESVVCIFAIVIDANKDVYTLVEEDRNALDKFVDCKMRRRVSCSQVRSREQCATFVIAIPPSKRRRPRKGIIVLANTTPTSTSSTPIRRSARLTKQVFQIFFIYIVKIFLINMQRKNFIVILFN